MENTINNTNLKPGGFYNWIIAVFCFLVFFISIGMIAGTGFSFYGPLMMESWNITNVQFSTIVSVRTFGGMVGMALCGVYYKKLSYRYGMAGGLILGVIGFAIFAYVPGFTMKCVASAFTGLCYGFGGMIPIAMVITKWFNKYRNTVIGICYCSSGLASTILPGILTALSSNFSLETSFMIEAAFAAAVAVLVVLFVRDTPEQMGMSPIGTEEDVKRAEEKAAAKGKKIEHYSYNKFSFIIILIVSFFIGAINYTAYNHFAMNLSTSGWSAEEVAAILACAGMTLLIGKPLYGAMADRFTAEKVSIIFYIFVLVAMVLAMMAGINNIYLQMVSLAVYGLGGVLATSGIASYCLDLSDDETREKITRYSFVVYSISGIVFSMMMGAIADATGRYTLGYAILAGLTVVTYILIIIAYKKAKAEYRNEMKKMPVGKPANA